MKNKRAVRFRENIDRSLNFLGKYTFKTLSSRLSAACGKYLLIKFLPKKGSVSEVNETEACQKHSTMLLIIHPNTISTHANLQSRQSHSCNFCQIVAGTMGKK